MSDDDSRDVPRRVHAYHEAEKRFGRLPARLVPYLGRSDDAADEVVLALAGLERSARHALLERALGGDFEHAPAALRAFVERSIVVPPWVDEARLARASAVFERAGILGGITLGLKSLVHGYAAPAGNKPLVFSGRLTERADRRLAETGRFVTAVTGEGGTAPFSPGFRATLHVRLMHAEVRRLVLSSGRWSTEEWGHPINQHDMLATILLFSNVFVDGIRQLGVHVTPDEADDYQHLFRRVGEVMGVAPELLPSTYREATRLSEFVHETQGRPDDDSRLLVRALLEGPLRAVRRPEDEKRARLQVAVAEGLCRSLVGDDLADALGIARDGHRHWARAVRLSLGLLERARRGLPRLDAVARLLGTRYWDFSLRRGLGDEPARFELPDALRGNRALS